MPLPTIPSGNVASALPTGFEVANSCRFNYPDAAYMSKTPSSGGSDTISTFSAWLKKASTGRYSGVFTSYSSTTNFFEINFESGAESLEVRAKASGSYVLRKITSRSFRDPSAWYHICVIIDTTNGTAEDRCKIYINGVRETSFSTSTNAGSSQDLKLNNTGYEHRLGRDEWSTPAYFDGYMAEVHWIDGTAKAVTDFGEFDDDSPTIWKPKEYTGGSYGTNGFYLDFEDSDNLGDDESGNTLDLSETNLAATDQATDSPTNNFATGNPLNWGTSWSGSLSNGNNTLAGSSSTNTYNTLFSTIAVNKGKWYAEFKITSASMVLLLGVSTPEAANLAAQTNKIPSSSYISTGHGYGLALNDGIVYFQNNSTTGQTDISGDGSQNDIIGIYLDLDNNKLYFGLNGTVLNSGTGIDITNDYYHFHAGDGSASGAAGGDMNFGANGAFGDTAVSSAVADANGYGAFEYDPSAGTFDSASKNFLALCTKNLATDG